MKPGPFGNPHQQFVRQMQQQQRNQFQAQQQQWQHQRAAMGMYQQRRAQQLQQQYPMTYNQESCLTSVFLFPFRLIAGLISVAITLGFIALVIFVVAVVIENA